MAGIYVHIPFCHSKCAYCDFYSVANRRRVDGYVAALVKEHDARMQELRGEEISTIYFGGGTPSILPPDAFTRIASLFPKEHVVEFTIEVNPEDVNAENIRVWRQAGVNRVSMGVQSLVDTELVAVGRRHTAMEALAAIKCLKDNGITNISCDLIYGLPGQTVESWEYSLEALLQQGIQHLSAYCLSYEPGTCLFLKRERGEVKETDDEILERMYDILCLEAGTVGMDHYEISNFAMPGMYSRHNSSYWNLTPYLGFGPGAHTLGIDGKRRYNPPVLKEYISNPETFTKVEEEDRTERFNDLLLISLRTAKGLPFSMIPDEFRTETVRKASRFLHCGMLVEKAGSYIIPEDKWLLADSVIRELFID